MDVEAPPPAAQQLGPLLELLGGAAAQLETQPLIRHIRQAANLR